MGQSIKLPLENPSQYTQEQHRHIETSSLLWKAEVAYGEIEMALKLIDLLYVITDKKNQISIPRNLLNQQEVWQSIQNTFKTINSWNLFHSQLISDLYDINPENVHLKTLNDIFSIKINFRTQSVIDYIDEIIQNINTKKNFLDLIYLKLHELDKEHLEKKLDILDSTKDHLSSQAINECLKNSNINKCFKITLRILSSLNKLKEGNYEDLILQPEEKELFENFNNHFEELFAEPEKEQDLKSSTPPLSIENELPKLDTMTPNSEQLPNLPKRTLDIQMEHDDTLEPPLVGNSTSLDNILGFNDPQSSTKLVTTPFETTERRPNTPKLLTENTIEQTSNKLTTFSIEEAPNPLPAHTTQTDSKRLQNLESLPNPKLSPTKKISPGSSKTSLKGKEKETFCHTQIKSREEKADKHTPLNDLMQKRGVKYRELCKCLESLGFTKVAPSGGGGHIKYHHPKGGFVVVPEGGKASEVPAYGTYRNILKTVKDILEKKD